MTIPKIYCVGEAPKESSTNMGVKRSHCSNGDIAWTSSGVWTSQKMIWEQQASRFLYAFPTTTYMTVQFEQFFGLSSSSWGEIFPSCSLGGFMENPKEHGWFSGILLRKPRCSTGVKPGAAQFSRPARTWSTGHRVGFCWWLNATSWGWRFPYPKWMVCNGKSHWNEWFGGVPLFWETFHIQQYPNHQVRQRSNPVPKISVHLQLRNCIHFHLGCVAVPSVRPASMDGGLLWNCLARWGWETPGNSVNLKWKSEGSPKLNPKGILVCHFSVKLHSSLGNIWWSACVKLWS